MVVPNYFSKDTKRFEKNPFVRSVRLLMKYFFQFDPAFSNINIWKRQTLLEHRRHGTPSLVDITNYFEKFQSSQSIFHSNWTNLIHIFFTRISPCKDAKHFLCKMSTFLNKHDGPAQCTKFKSWLGIHLFKLIYIYIYIFLISFSRPRHVLRWYLAICHDHFLVHTFPSTMQITFPFNIK